MDRNEVVLVDPHDQVLGTMEKMEAHRKGVLHRAFSIFIFNDQGELLIHQRAIDKYHGGGLWTNTCCSHPQPNEQITLSAKDRLMYEMGMECELTPLFSFIYHAPVENNLIEHELDHVLIGFNSSEPDPNPSEVQDFNWVPIPQLINDIAEFPSHYTIWFKTCLPNVLKNIEELWPNMFNTINSKDI
jgi:isopentenyl-diphosphate delta-isomerase